MPADDELASRLRHAVFRLTRVLRQLDDSGLSPALLSALAVVERDGAITLGELAAQEQLAPPTITKVVVALEERGLVDRIKDDTDKRVCRVRVTAKGRRRLEASRTRRTAWLATRLDELTDEERRRLTAAVDVIEQLAAARAKVPHG